MSKRTEYNKRYYEKHKERLKLEQKEYQQANSAIIKLKRDLNKEEYKKRYHGKYKNVGISKEKKNAYVKHKRAANPLFKLKMNLRTMITTAFRRKGYNKLSKTAEILGCSYDEFKTYIESLWEPWMNWDNYGLYNGAEGYGWDIDHIIALNTAKTEEELLRLNHYTNLQPLCSYKNRVIKK